MRLGRDDAPEGVKSVLRFPLCVPKTKSGVMVMQSAEDSQAT